MIASAVSRLPQFAVALAAALVALAVFLALARRLGWVDTGADAPERKRQRTAVALVGGPALAVALLALAWQARGDGAALVGEVWPDWSLRPAWLGAALALAFATGFADDVRARGLAPAPKLIGQLAAGVALAAGLEHGGAGAPLAARAACVVLAVAAQNVANTFDHADGMLASVSLAGLAGAGAALAGALCAFLPFNLIARRGADVPRAYLGDSGAHVLGIALLASPFGAAALTLPALDLARVVAARVRAGQPVWHGDRRHLAHRLQDAGRGRGAVVLRSLACAAPAFLAQAFLAPRLAATDGGPLIVLGAGALASGLALAWVLARHPARAPA